MSDISGIYSSLRTAADEIKRRWSDDNTARKIEMFLGGDIPEFLKSEPHIILFRHIATPDAETSRLLELSREAGLPPLILEYTGDKFVAFNADKYRLLYPSFRTGIFSQGKERFYKLKIADLHSAQGKPLNGIRTRWGVNVVDFHHEILFRMYPELRGKVFDITEWLARNGGLARLYYKKFIALLIRHCVLAEDYMDTGNEEKFMEEKFMPALGQVQRDIGLKPLVVKLAPADAAELVAPWWHHGLDAMNIAKSYIDELKASETVAVKTKS